jgi:23S rRNA (cytosine1962-C5)-methyltransferase
MNDDLFAPARRRILTLKPGKERAVRNMHPWIFAGAIGNESGANEAAIADLVDASGTVIASGFHSRRSQIRLRAVTWGDVALTEELLHERIVAAIERRRPLLGDTLDAVRLVHAEGDELSGLVIDQYRDVVVVEIANRGLEQLKPLIIETLKSAVQPRIIYFKNDLPLRELEQLPAQATWDGSGGAETDITEHGLTFHVDPKEGQKTGFFLDQRENRQLGRTLSRDARMLNLFSYSGGFGVYAAAGGAKSVENVDVSAPAIEMARRNHALNGSEAQTTFTVADAFSYVRLLARRPERFDLVVCDPPAFAKNRNDVERAARGYKDVNLHAMKIIENGGYLMTFSCSGHMSLDLFQKVIFSAALDAKRRISIVSRLGAGPDHPISLFCPEGEYLKGFLLQVTG